MYISLLYLIGCGQTEVKQEIAPEASKKTETVDTTKDDPVLADKNVNPKENKKEVSQKNDSKNPEKQPDKKDTTDFSLEGLITLDRIGEIPTLNYSEIKPIEGSNCYFTVDMAHNKIYSNYRMRRMGAAKASPILVTYNDKKLQHITPADMQKGQKDNTCSNTYAFPAKDIIISTQEKNTNTSDLSIQLNPEFPFEQFGSEYWWIYTKTQLRVILAESKDLYEKEVEVNVQLRKMGGAKEIPHLLINKEKHEFTFDEESNIFSFSKPFPISSRAFVIYTVVPSGCSDMLIEDFSLTIDDQTHSVLDKKSVKVSN